jgi:hypothetical protein
MPERQFADASAFLDVRPADVRVIRQSSAFLSSTLSPNGRYSGE